MPHFSLISVLLFLPLLGAVFLLFVRGDDRITAMNSRHVALLISGCTFVLALTAWTAGTYAEGRVNFQSRYEGFPALGISWHVGIDALSLIFVLLISFLTLLCVYTSRKRILTMVREFMIVILVMESFLLTAVCARDFLQMFLFAEGAAVPLFLLIAVWGIEKRAFSSFRFCLYSVFGSSLLFLALLYLYVKTGTADVESLKGIRLPVDVQQGLLALFAAAFAFKAPLFPFHAWFTDAQTEAPVPVAAVLSGAFTKMAFYIFLRAAVPVLPDALPLWSPGLSGWAVFSAVYGALITIGITDMRKTAGYVHIAQTGVMALGLFCLMPEALKGTLFLCFAQGLSLIFFLLTGGALLERMQNREARTYAGLIADMPFLGTFFLLSCLAASAFPGTPSFLGNFLIWGSTYGESRLSALFAAVSGIFLYAAFFPMFSRLMLGEREAKDVPPLPDLNWREKTAFSVLGAVLLYLALLPDTVMKLVSAAAHPLFTAGL